MATAQKSQTKPAALKRGDAIAIVALASNVKRDPIERGCETLRRMGYAPFFSASLFDQDLYFAGTLERRVRELTEMFEHDDVKAIVCARGGYGANYLLPAVDLDVVRKHPKIFVGYSDLTCLLTYFADAAGLVVFHGPMVNKDWSTEGGVDIASWQAAMNACATWQIETGAGSGVEALVAGKAEGILYGGCLSILTASLGTPYEIQTDGTILFLEDVAAKPYQIDRMLMQLKLAGKLKDVRGIVFGEMLDCLQVQGKDQGYTLQEVVLRVVGDLGIPIAYGLRSGHVSRGNVTLPIGVRASLEISKSSVELKILEAATI